MDTQFLEVLSPYAAILRAGRSLTGADLIRLLSEVADAEVAAAERALEDANVSNEPTREIDAAIFALRLAFERYRTLEAKNSSFPRFFFVGPGTDQAVSKRSVQIAMALSAVYASQRDKKLCKRYYELADECFLELGKKWVANKTAGRSGRARTRSRRRLEEKVKTARRVLTQTYCDIANGAFSRQPEQKEKPLA